MAVHMNVVRPEHRGMRLLTDPIHILQEHRRAYITLNILYYGIIILGMIYAAFDPALQQTILQSLGTAFTQGPLAAVGDAYINAKVLEATGLTFVVNLLIGSFATITLPSLVIPFSGLLMGAYRAFLWGLIYSPTTPDMQTILLPHSLTLILEGQAYVLALLGAVIQGRALFIPRTVGEASRLRALWAALKLTARLYVLIAVVLAIAAIYEVLEAVMLLSTLGN